MTELVVKDYCFVCLWWCSGGSFREWIIWVIFLLYVLLIKIYVLQLCIYFHELRFREYVLRKKVFSAHCENILGGRPGL